ncbi:hypothetical protein EVAR_53221_1 [Eumeta japonica]|uniref:Uncharacterized protein n=1 Tax=Eumeta variegata TaxID=151549 RepID=A0A4C1XBT8_EUMVA|nr:hypothetical protein EVAR_53221_1 [Eumeta japonica]
MRSKRDMQRPYHVEVCGLRLTFSETGSCVGIEHTHPAQQVGSLLTTSIGHSNVRIRHSQRIIYYTRSLRIRISSRSKPPSEQTTSYHRRRRGAGDEREGLFSITGDAENSRPSPRRANGRRDKWNVKVC